MCVCVAQASEVMWMSWPKKRENADFFYQHLDTWLNDVAYKGKHVVVCDKKVQHICDRFEDALAYASAHCPIDEFVIQHVISPDEEVGFLRLAR